MPRVLLLAMLAALVASGCGDSAPSAGPATSPSAVPGPAKVETTDGRLGPATAMRPGSRPRELSAGGRPDLRERSDRPRRDGVGAGAACANRDLAPSAESVPAVADATLCLLNGERADHGLAPLALDGRLGTAASAYAHDLVAGSYFAHVGRDGSDVLARIERTGYIRRGRGWMVGENLAWGTGALATPGSIMQAWMNSPGHRENILEPSFRQIGIGIVAGNPARTDGAGATYATEFGVIEGADTVVRSTKRKGSKGRKARQAAKRRARALKARTSRRHGSRGNVRVLTARIAG